MMKSRREFLREASYLFGGARLLPSIPVAFGARGAASTEAASLPGGLPRTALSLDGDGWKLVGLELGQGEKLGVNLRDSAKAAFIPTSVPNDVQLVIGIKDVYSQDPAIFEVNKQEWWYVRSFASPKLQPNQQVRLVFDGVDYFADVWLNGEKLGSHEGSFTRFGFDLSKGLRSKGDNYLAVRVTSPISIPGISRYGFMKGEFTNAGGWDALPGPGQWAFPLGIHRSVRLEITAKTRLEELRVATLSLREQQAELKLQVAVSSAGAARHCRVRIAIKPENFSGPALTLPEQPVSFDGEQGRLQEVALTAQVDHPQLWWTWDQGPQNLYVAEATLLDSRGAVLDRMSSTFGIRTLERSANLLYKLNGRPFFVHGAWYAMSRIFPGDANRWIYEKDLRLARNANMNHLVNFTVVERDEFYELADRLGILLFVELPWYQYGPMDALNPLYAHRDEFLRWSVREVAKIARALGNHPSIGVWGPLSETTSNGHDFASNPDRRIADAADGYRLFVDKLEEVIKENDSDALYFPSYCDFGERHFWEASFFPGTYDQHFDSEAPFVSEFGGWAYFPLESIKRIVDPNEIWNDKYPRWSILNLPVNLQKLSYVTGNQYAGLDLLTSQLELSVDRNPRSFREYVSDSQVYQAWLYTYITNAFRRKLFSPVNGVRSWMFKNAQQKPFCELGVIDCFGTPMMGYYAEKKGYAPVVLSYAVRYALESVPAGSQWKVPVWISNATNDDLLLSVESVLFSLKGERLRQSQQQVSVPARKAQEVFNLDWQLPEEAGIYLLRGRARNGQNELASAEMYVKVVPRAIRRPLRVLVLGTRDWAPPVTDYLANFGALVTAVMPEPTIIRQPENPFPDSPESLRQNYDVIWLTGFDNYWREVPDEWSEIIVKAVESGVTFVHTGSWASFHGGVPAGIGSASVAALDLSVLAKVLPVELVHENDVYVSLDHDRPTTRILPQPVNSRPGAIKILPAAPQCLRQVDFSGLTLTSYHVLKPRPGAEVLLQVDSQPLLVMGRFGQGRTIAYLGFSPVADSKPVILDRAIRWSADRQLFAIVSATLLVLSSGENPPGSVKGLLETRATPLYETLKNMPQTSWPEVSLSWTRTQGCLRARIHLRNGGSYIRGLRLRFDGPDFVEGKALPLWSDQFFDLLPGEESDCTVEIITENNARLQACSLEAETLYGNESKTYVIPAPSQ